MEISIELSEILGLLCSEGSYILSYSTYEEKNGDKHRIREKKKSERIEFYNNDPNLLEHYKKLLKKEFDYDSNITKDNKINIGKRDIIKKIISFTSLSCRSWAVPEQILNGNNEVKISFIRGYFDGDGTASKSIRFFSINKKGLIQVSKLLKDIEIDNYFETPLLKKGRYPLHSIRLPNKEKENFLNIVQPISKHIRLRGLHRS